MAKKKARAKNSAVMIPAVYRVIVIGYACYDYEFFFTRRPVRKDIIKLLKKVGSYDVPGMIDESLTIRDVVDIHRVKIQK